MKIAYFDCFAGISGDMVLGALVNAGLLVDDLLKELKKLNLKGYKIEAKAVNKLGIQATKVSVQSSNLTTVRRWAEIKELISKSNLDSAVKDRSLQIFLQVASAEAKIHGRELEQVHFHEVGAIDSIIDIVGVAIGLHRLNIKEIYSSPLPLGRTLGKSKHGNIPIPAPATLEILRDVPIYGSQIQAELVTPTGAAIIKSYAKEFGAIPAMKIRKIGYGAGSRDLEIPNVLRIYIGEKVASTENAEDIVSIIAANIDDMNPEFYEHVINRLLRVGALDVWLTPIQMKKNRPAITLNLISPLNKTESLTKLLFEETTTLGVRILEARRKKLERETMEVNLPSGPVRVKIGRLEGKVVNVSPEIDDCKKLASKTRVALKVIYEAAKSAAFKLLASQ